MSDPQKEAREIAERHGVKAYEPAETGKKPRCECPRKARLENIRSSISALSDFMYEPVRAVAQYCFVEIDAALADPCSCEQLRGEKPSQSAWVALMQYAYAGDKDGAREMQQILAHYNWIRVDRARLREQNVGLRAAVRNQSRTISELQAECEKLRERAAELEMARDVAQDSAALWTKNAFTAVVELHAARTECEQLREEVKTLRHSLELVLGKATMPCSKIEDGDNSAPCLGESDGR